MFTGSMALLHRALRLDARLLHTHLFRLGFAVVIYISLTYAHAVSLSFSAPGLKLFELLSILNVGLISLAGVGFFATAISEEKEEETLGLLRMAGVDPIGILLGKSTSRLIGALLLLLVQFPFTLLAITLGGVTFHQVISAYCTLAAYLILLANIGLFASVVSRRASNASALTVLLLVIYFSGGYLVEVLEAGLSNGGLISRGAGLSRSLKWLAAASHDANAVTRIQEILKTGFDGSPVGLQVITNVFLAGACFCLAWVGFDRFTRDSRVMTGAGVTGVDARSRWLSGKVSRPWKNPLMWKEFQFTAGGIRVQWLKFAGYGLVSILIYWAAERYYQYSLADAAHAVVWFLLAGIVLESSLYVSRIFHDEWRERTLPILMMLPHSTPWMTYSKVVGCLPALIPAGFWLLISALIHPAGLGEVALSLVLPSRWFGILVVLLFLTLTAFFSLVVRWGALPLAIAVMLVGATFGSCFAAPILGAAMSFGSDSRGMEGAFLCVDIVIVLLIAGLQFDVHRRLEIAATQ